MAELASIGSSKDLILNAAEDLFASQGFGPTTVKQIGARAGQNPALLYYYFGSKEALYRSVLERVVGGMVARGGAVLERTPAPPEAVRGLVQAQIEFLLSHPNAPKLLVREMVDHEARRAETVLIETAAGLFRRLCRVIEQGQEQGHFRNDLEPRFAAISTIAQGMYFTVARPAIAIFLGEPVSPSTARAFARHGGEFAVAALSHPPGLAADSSDWRKP